MYEQGPASRYLNIRQSGGALLSRETYNGSGELQASRTYHYDGLGSAIALTNESGQVTDTYSYSEWGSVTHSGTTTDNPYQYAGRYGYYTHYQESGFGLIQTGARYYDPATGRYTQRDPIGDSASAYSYAGNEPMRYIDPSGLSRRGTDDWLADFPEVQPYANFCDASAIPRILVSTVSQEATDSINRDLMTLGLRDCNGNGYGWSGPVGIMMLEDAADRALRSAAIIGMGMGVGGLIERGVAYAAEGAWAAAGKEVMEYAANEALSQVTGLPIGLNFNLESHHLLPKKFRDWFLGRGLDVEDYLVDLPTPLHRLKVGRGLHTNQYGKPGRNWNAMWARWIEENRTGADADMVLGRLSYMIDYFNIGHKLRAY